MSQNTINNIPDISYQLVFCFLAFKELPRIAQCSKEWKRIVIIPSFLNMFPKQQMKFSNQIIKSLSLSPFRQIIHQIIPQSLDFLPINETFILIHFNHIVSLELSICWQILVKDLEFDITPVFQALAPRLQQLRVKIDKWIGDTPPLSFYHFQNALSLLTSLTHLSLFSFVIVNIFNNLRFLSQMTHLQMFSSNCIDQQVYTGQLVDHFLHCPNLTHLNLPYFFRDKTIDKLSELCSGLQHSKLKHLGCFHEIPQNQQHLCLESLSKMRNLESIHIAPLVSIVPNNIPILLGRWIHWLEVHDAKLDERDLNSIQSLTHLKTFRIIFRYAQNEIPIMRSLILCLSSSLEKIWVESAHATFGISFKSLSKFIHLKAIQMINIHGLLGEGSEGHLDLLKCKQLNEILIDKCDFTQDMLHPKMQEAFILPSKEFPLLKKCSIVKHD
jgi:hypothetical protein